MCQQVGEKSRIKIGQRLLPKPKGSESKRQDLTPFIPPGALSKDYNGKAPTWRVGASQSHVFNESTASLAQIAAPAIYGTTSMTPSMPFSRCVLEKGAFLLQYMGYFPALVGVNFMILGVLLRLSSNTIPASGDLATML